MHTVNASTENLCNFITSISTETFFVLKLKVVFKIIFQSLESSSRSTEGRRFLLASILGPRTIATTTKTWATKTWATRTIATTTKTWATRTTTTSTFDLSFYHQQQQHKHKKQLLPSVSWSTNEKIWTLASSVMTQPPVNTSNLFSKINNVK